MVLPVREKPGPFSGLSVRLVTIIVLVILAVEVVVYVPSVASFRAGWLEDRVQVGAVAANVVDAVPDVMDLPPAFTERLLDSARATAIAYRSAERSLLIERIGATMPTAAVTADTREANPLALIAAALDTLFSGGDRMLRIVGEVPGTGGQVEVLMAEAPLRAEMLVYSRNILILSLIIAVMTALTFYFFLDRAVIRPIRELTANMIAFREAPENASLIIAPSERRDEIGVAERELAAMEADLFTMLRQRRHLADLGLAVAKINHDLRNTLTSAQLLSDQVATLDDPEVQRLAPRLVTTLDRAIGFAQSVLDHGREAARPPRPVPVDLRALIDEAAFDAGLAGHPAIRFDNRVPDAIALRIDPEQMARVFVNLLRNAREALEQSPRPDGAGPALVDAAFARTDDGLTVSITDNGPGLPPRARENLFVAFEGSARAGGTGLGLAIARELVEAHGGRLAWEGPGAGTRFTITLPEETLLG